MSAAALTPRVQIMVICAEVNVSETEIGVFTLEGVRQHLDAETFPCHFQPRLFLLLSSARRGTYQGKVLVIDQRTDRTIRYVKFDASFQEDNERLPLRVDIGTCTFPEPGPYSFEVWFSSQDGTDLLKAEQVFDILTNEE